MVTPLNVPREITVISNPEGEPVSVILGIRRRVAAVLNQWRVDDEWWRDEVSRRYFQVQLDDGSVVTIFQDLLSGRWYRQR